MKTAGTIIKLGLILGLICLVAAVSLSYTYEKTGRIIEQNEKQKQEAALSEVLPLAESFRTVKVRLNLEECGVLVEKLNLDLQTDNNGEKYFTVHLGVTGKGEECQVAGVAFNINPFGYAGKINILLGIDNNNAIAGIKILGHRETPGLGSKIEEINSSRMAILKKINPRVDEHRPWFQEQFKGLKDEDQICLKVDDQSGENKAKIDAITAATITSRAVTDGIRNGLVFWSIIKKETLKEYHKLRTE